MKKIEITVVKYYSTTTLLKNKKIKIMKNLLQYNSYKHDPVLAIKILAKNASDLDFYKKENSIRMIIKNNFLDDIQQYIITKIKNNQIEGIICVYHSSQYIHLSVVNNDDYFMKKIYKHLKKLKHKIIVNEIEQLKNKLINMNEIEKFLKIEIEQLKTDVSKLKKEIEELKNPIIKLKEMTNNIRRTYVLYTTDKDVNILFINYERFQNEPRLYKVVDKLNYDYKVYLNKKNEIQFATDDTGKTVVGISEENFENFDIIKEFFCR